MSTNGNPKRPWRRGGGGGRGSNSQSRRAPGRGRGSATQNNGSKKDDKIQAHCEYPSYLQQYEGSLHSCYLIAITVIVNKHGHCLYEYRSTYGQSQAPPYRLPPSFTVLSYVIGCFGRLQADEITSLEIVFAPEKRLSAAEQQRWFTPDGVPVQYADAISSDDE